MAERPYWYKDIEYDTSTEFWPNQGLAYIVTSQGIPFAAVPVQFVCAGEYPVSNIAYLHRVLKGLISNLPEDGPLLQLDGTFVSPQCEIRAATYTLPEPAHDAIEFRAGPQGKSYSKKFQDTDGSSTVSRSSRSSTHQSRFREALFLRDGMCIVTGIKSLDRITAAHVVPMSLGQSFLSQITGQSALITLYSERNGFVLERGMHMLYDRYKLGFYIRDDGQMIVHSFSDDAKMYHGRPVITREYDEDTRRPDVKLINWHYDQCLMARFRGFKI